MHKLYTYFILIYTLIYGFTYGQSGLAHLQNGKLKSKAGDFSGAIVEFTKAIAIDSTCSQAFFLRGKAKFALTDYIATLKDWEKASSLGLPDAKNLLQKHTELLELSKKQELENERKTQIAATEEKREVNPQFPGGEEALLSYINENISYPFRAKIAGIEGKTG
ncbi:MAG: hypothetical protein HYV28_12670 [Ignavibacteriales bacterium]|nr:hypothetical protein [Ignavibacteriales bacterium]